MFRLRYLLLFIVLCTFCNVEAQRTYREHLRSGNNIYADSVYDKSEIEYRKAIELNPKSAEAHFNLGNALMFQNKYTDAIKEYEQAIIYEKDKNRLSQIYHNMGVAMQLSKDYSKAVEAYKQSLLRNPHDNETRYNLAMLMKQQQQNQQDKKDNQQQEQQEQQEQQQNQQQDKQEKEQQEQQQNQQQQQQENKDEMSEENAQQLLQSAMQDEKDVQEKVQRMMQVRGKKLEKDW